MDTHLDITDRHHPGTAGDPSPDLPYIQSAAVAPDAVYLAVNYSNSGWTVVKVPRR